MVCFSQNIHAQSNPKTTETLEVVGTGQEKISKNENFKKNPTGFQKEVKIDENNNRYLSLPDLLEKEAGIRVRQYGGLGSYSTLSLRGANPNQTRIYWNGIPINQGQNGEINLADLPFDNLEKIEIYKSSTPAGFSGSSIGGSINLVSKQNITKKSTRFTLQGGSLKTIKGVLSQSDKTSFGSYFVQALGEKSDQNFAFLNNQGTLILNTIDDRIDQRKNAQYEKAGFKANLNFDFGKTTVSLLNDYLYRFQGLPGPGNRQTNSVERKFERFSTAIASDTKELFVTNLRLETKIYHTANREQLFDPKSEFSFGTPNAFTKSNQSGIQISPTLYLLSYNQILRFSLNVEQEFFNRIRRRSDNSNDSKEPNRRRDYQTFQVQDEIRLFDERLILAPQIRWDFYQDYYGLDLNSIRSQTFDLFSNASQVKREFTNPSFGARFQVSKGKSDILEWDWGLKANISRDFRIPTFIELFGERGTIIGNTGLRPESSRNQDIGIYFKSKWKKSLSWEGDAAVFSKKIENMILFVPNSQFTLRPENLDAASIRGFETNQFLIWNDAYKLNVNYTYQNPINVSRSSALDGKYLPLRPRNQASITASILKAYGEIGVEFLYIGSNYRDRTNEFFGFLAAREIYNFFATWNAYQNEEKKEQFLITFEVRNVTNKLVEDFVGYPLPGRLFFLSGSYRF